MPRARVAGVAGFRLVGGRASPQQGKEFWMTGDYRVLGVVAGRSFDVLRGVVAAAFEVRAFDRVFFLLRRILSLGHLRTTE
jgi:hypothetical protein